MDLERTELKDLKTASLAFQLPPNAHVPPELLPGHLPVQNLALQRLSTGQMLSSAAANTAPEERSLQAGEPCTTMLGFLHFMLSYSPLSASFPSPASKKASKGRVTLPQPLFVKRAAFPPPPCLTVFFHLQTLNLHHLSLNAIVAYLPTPRPCCL